MTTPVEPLASIGASGTATVSGTSDKLALPEGNDNREVRAYMISVDEETFIAFGKETGIAALADGTHALLRAGLPYDLKAGAGDTHIHFIQRSAGGSIFVTALTD